MIPSERTPDRAAFLSRIVALAGTAALIFSLLWLDRNRAGPATAMARCNLLLSRASEPAADVLLIGSSRMGVALDPVAMQRILSAELERKVHVDRLSLPHNPLRTMSALLGNYLQARGSPDVVALEIMFMTERSLNRLAQRGLALAPENYIYERDVNLLTFEQLIGQPSVAMPFTKREGTLTLWSQRLKGVVLRSGALVYQAVRDPLLQWNLSACTREDWRREAAWSANFAFSYGDFEPGSSLRGLVDDLETETARRAEEAVLDDWQSPNLPDDIVYPYDFNAAYRQGEVNVLVSMIERLLEHGTDVILIPLTLYGYELDRRQLLNFASGFSSKVHLFDLYGEVSANFDSLWYDDAHVRRFPVGHLTTVLMAKRLMNSRALSLQPPPPDG